MAQRPPVPDQTEPSTLNKNTVRCGARTKSNGTPCPNPAVKGSKRCRLHGGKSLKGMASQNFRHGRYSKYLPKGLLDTYHEAESDPELLSLRADVALIQTRVMELTKRLHGEESGSMWRRLRDAWRNFQVAHSSGDPTLLAPILTEIHNIIIKGASEEDVWSELIETTERKDRLASSEWKRLVDMKQVMTAERATLFAVSLLDAVLRYVPEMDRRASISLAFEKMLSNHNQNVPIVVEAQVRDAEQLNNRDL